MILVGEAMACIASPILLGQIVNTGIQCRGFNDDYPIVMNHSILEMFSDVLPGDEYEELQESYCISREIPDGIDEKYHTISKKYYVKSDADISSVKELYENAVFSAVVAVKDKYNIDNIEYDSFTNDISASKITLIKSLDLTEKEKENYYNQAVETPASVKKQIADMILPLLYQYSGIDCDAAQKEYTTNMLICFIAVLAVQCVLAAVSTRIISNISSDFEFKLRKKILQKSSRFSQEDFSVYSPEKIFYSYRTGTKQIGIAINFALRNVFYSIGIVAFGCVYSFSNSLWFGGLILISFIATLIIFLILYKVSILRYARMQENYYKYSSKIITNIKNIFSIRNAGAQKLESSQNVTYSEAVRKDESYVMKAILLALSSAGLFVNLLTALVVFIGGNDMLVSDINLGNIIADLQISMLTVSSLLSLCIMVIFSPTALSAYKEIEKILSYRNKKIKSQNPVPESTDIIEVKNLKLFKNSKEQSFTLEKGKINVFIGPSGSGKSTMIKSILRENKFFSGAISVNGKDIKSFPEGFPAQAVSYVPSNPVIFTDTVKNNMLIFGAENNSSSMLESLKLAECDFFAGSRNPLDVFIENNADKYSGGQKSRLTLAFALSKKSDVYIFDDCLSSLDIETKKRILNNIENLKKDSIIIIVSQDNNDINIADKVIYFE